MRIVRIHQGKTFSLQLRLIVALFLGVSMVLIMEQIHQPYSIGIAIILSALIPAAWFTTNILTIDLEKCRIFVGIWVMGFKFGKETSFYTIEKILIKKLKTTQKLYSLANNLNIITRYEYHAFLKLDSDELFFLVSHPIEERIIEKCQQAIRKLRLSEELLVLPDQ